MDIFFKGIVAILFALCGWTKAGYLHSNGGDYGVISQHVVPVYHGGIGGESLNYYKYPKYSYKYGVHDFLTGDIKNQWETRKGDLVKGSYSLKEADGTTRVVDYSADKYKGFNAVVKTLGHPKIYQSYHVEGNNGGSSYGFGPFNSVTNLKHL